MYVRSNYENFNQVRLQVQFALKMFVLYYTVRDLTKIDHPSLHIPFTSSQIDDNRHNIFFLFFSSQNKLQHDV